MHYYVQINSPSNKSQKSEKFDSLDDAKAYIESVLTGETKVFAAGHGNINLYHGDEWLDGYTMEQMPCEHEWHRYGTVNGRPDYGCQKCGATRAE